MTRSGFEFSEVLEQALCAMAWGYRWEEWEALDAERQAFCLAVYRAQLQMTAVEIEYRKR